MIFIQIEIEEREPGVLSLQAKAPPRDATLREVALAEKISAALERIMAEESRSGSQVYKVQPR